MRHPRGGSYNPYRGTKGWVAVVTVGLKTDGKPDRKTQVFHHSPTGSKGQLTKADDARTERRAYDWISEIHDQLDAGTYGKAPEVTPTAHTLRSYAKFHFDVSETAGNLRANVRAQYEMQMRLYLEPFLDRRLDEIRPADLLAHYTAKIKDGGSVTGIRKANMGASAVATAAVELGDLAMNPFQLKKRLPKATTKKRVVWSREEWAQFVAFHVAQPADPETGKAGRRQHPDLELVWLQLDSCVRRSELLGLRWCDVDLDDEPMVRVRFTVVVNSATGRPGPPTEETKTEGSQRDIPITDETAALLRDLRERQRERAELLGVPFTDDRPVAVDSVRLQPIRPEQWLRVVNKMSAAAGVSRIGTHGIRATGLTWVTEDIHLVAAMERAGHTSVKTTKGYVQTSSAEARKGADAMSRSMGERPVLTAA